jgi:hypothetical protein
MQLALPNAQKDNDSGGRNGNKGCFMSLASALRLDQSAGDLGRSEMDETSAMVYLGDIYSVLLLAGCWDGRAASDTDTPRRAPLDTVWPFIR